VFFGIHLQSTLKYISSVEWQKCIHALMHRVQFFYITVYRKMHRIKWQK